MKIISLHGASEKREIVARGKPWPTAIFKAPIKGPVFLDTLGITSRDGGKPLDIQAHEMVHGGEGRALYAISLDAYEIWKKLVPAGVDMSYGAFGENATLESLNEPEIEVGDTFELGGAVIQATMPRFPCLLFAARMQMESDAQKTMTNSDHPGVLFRVLKPGLIDCGDVLRPLSKSNSGLTMTDFIKMKVDDMVSQSDFDRINVMPVLPQKMKDRFALSLDKWKKKQEELTAASATT